VRCTMGTHSPVEVTQPHVMTPTSKCVKPVDMEGGGGSTGGGGRGRGRGGVPLLPQGILVCSILYFAWGGCHFACLVWLWPPGWMCAMF
jgi:hypothetical protein